MLFSFPFPVPHTLYIHAHRGPSYYFIYSSPSTAIRILLDQAISPLHEPVLFNPRKHLGKR